MASKFSKKKKESQYEKAMMPPLGHKSKHTSWFDDENDDVWDDKAVGAESKKSTIPSLGVGKYASKAKSAGKWLSSRPRTTTKKSMSDAEDQRMVIPVKTKSLDRNKYTYRTVDSNAINVVKQKGSHRWRQLGKVLLGPFMDSLESVFVKLPDEAKVEYILQRWMMKVGDKKATVKELLNACDHQDINIRKEVWSGLVSVPVLESVGQRDRLVSLRQSANVQFVKVGSRVKLHCQASGTPDPVTYQWYVNDEIIKGENRETMEVTIGGSYHCVASGTFGSIIGEPIEVYVVRQLASDRVAAQGTEALLDYYHSRNLIVTTPSEILSLGRKVQRAYLEAIRTNGCIRCPRVRLMVVGQDRAGKSSLVRALLNSLQKTGSMVPPSDSTSGIDIALVKCSLDDDNYLFEVVEGLASELQTIKKLQARHVAELILQMSNKSTKEYNTTADAGPVGGKINVASTAAEVFEPAEEQSVSTTGKPIDSSVMKASNNQDNVLSEDWKTHLDEEMARLVNEELKTIKEGQSLPHHNRHSSSDFSDFLWLRLYDFAGQPIYYNTHSCFMSSHGIYLIVHNLEKNLDDPAVVCIGREGKEFIIEAGCGTNRDYLLTWMTAVSITEPAFSSLLTRLTPSALVVGTHYDIIRKYYPNLSERSRFLTAKEVAIEAAVNRFPLSRHFRRPFFYVDNLLTCDDAESQLVCLRKMIVDLAMEDEQSEALIPFSWLRFEVDVYTEASKNSDGYWSYTEAIERASHCFSMQNVDREEIQSMFKFYHRLGVIMWFGDSAALSQYVVINTQLLLNLFRSVISLDPALDDRKTFWKSLRETGVLDYKHVDDMLEASIISNQSKTSDVRILKERKEFLLKMLQMFGLITPLFSCNSVVKKFHSGITQKSSQFVIPSLVIQDVPVQAFAPELDSCPSIYLTSLHRLVPAALYNRLVVYLIRLFPLSPAVYRHFARLHMDRNNDLLIFNYNTDKSGRIKIAIQNLINDANGVISVQPSELLQYVIWAISDIKSQGMGGLQFVLEALVTCNGTEPMHQHFFPVFQSECTEHALQSCCDLNCVDKMKQRHVSNVSGVHSRCGVNQCFNPLSPPDSLDQWVSLWTEPNKHKVVNVHIVSGSFKTKLTGIVAGDIQVREGDNSEVAHHENVTVVPGIPYGTVQLVCPLQHCGEDQGLVKYHWFRSGKPIAVQNSNCLEIKGFNAYDDSGIYCCQVVSSRDYTYSRPVYIQALSVSLKEPPAVRIYVAVGKSTHRVKEKSSVSLGQKIRLLCTAEPSVSDMRLHYQWFQNKLAIPHAVHQTLEIESVQDFHDGIYYCIVSDQPVDPRNTRNSCVTSSHAEVIIASPDWREDECWFQHQVHHRQRQIQVATYKAYGTKATDKVALLIGNKEYTRMKGNLLFPENDVVAVADALRRLNFKVFVFVNLKFFEMCHALQMFYELVCQGVYAVFYFAGHGFEFNRETYLMPVDADLGNVKTCFRETAIEYSLQECGARLGLLLLDCCRVWTRCVSEKCALPTVGVGSIITQYSCCSLNAAYEVSSSGTSHSVYADHLCRVLEGLAVGGTITVPVPAHTDPSIDLASERKVATEATSRSTDNGTSDRQLSESDDVFKLSVQNMLEDVAIAVSNERVSKRRGGADTPWQVPQRKEHIIESDLSLADDVDTHGDIAKRNDKYHKALNRSRTVQSIEKAVSSCGLFKVYLVYEMWVANVLLVGINVIPVDKDQDESQLKVNMRIESNSASLIHSGITTSHELNVVRSMPNVADCSHYMKVYNVHRLQHHETLTLVVDISRESADSSDSYEDSLELIVGGKLFDTYLQYSHGQRAPLSALVSRLKRGIWSRPLLQRERSFSLPMVLAPTSGQLSASSR